VSATQNDFDNCGYRLLRDPDRSTLSPWESWRAHETTGSYETEELAKSELMRHISDEHWSVEQEVVGQVVHPKQDCRATSVRIDYILWPKEPLISAGWSVGPIGVEVKRSGVKLGPVISQALDYMRCQYSCAGGLAVRPKFCVIFPLDRVQEAVQSVMSSERIGHAHVGMDGKLRIYLNGQCAYMEGPFGVFLRSALRSGKKFGSR